MKFPDQIVKKDDDMNANERLAHWASSVSTVHTPLAIERAENAVIDTIACMLIGSQHPVTERILAAVAQWGNGNSTIIGCPHKTAAPWAALVNGTSAHAIDFDDYNETPSFTHPSSVILPALLAIAEEQDKSGADVLDAFIVGVEVIMRIGEAVNPSHYKLGWHATSTIGALGAAVSSARLIGLDSNAISSALSIATSHASGYNSQFGTMAKPLHAGFAAHTGVLAAQFAAMDISASTTTLDGKWSFLSLLSTKEVQDFDNALEKLGRKLAIEEYGLTIKPYPCCSAIHRAIDGILDLRTEYNLSPADVAAITVRIPAAYADILPFVFPESDTEARFSMTYCVAVALFSGDLLPVDFTMKAIKRSEIRALISLITMKRHSGTTQNQDIQKPDIVTIELKTGRILERIVDKPLGSIDRPFDKTELQAKFTHCAQDILGQERCSKLISLLQNLGTLERLSELMSLL